MFWGANEARPAAAADPQRRARRLLAAVAVALLSVGGTVAMASASTGHATAAVTTTSSASSSETGPSSPATGGVAGITYRIRPKAAVPTTVAVIPPAPPVHHVAAPATPRPTTAVTAVHVAPRAPVHVAPSAAAHVVSAPVESRPVVTVPAAPPAPASDTCAAAIAYLSAHAAPGFHFECPGYALGHQAMTCVNVAGVCPGTDLIVISTVCPASYMNEAHNSWIVAGLSTGSIDPYGYCS